MMQPVDSCHCDACQILRRHNPTLVVAEFDDAPAEVRPLVPPMQYATAPELSDDLKHLRERLQAGEWRVW